MELGFGIGAAAFLLVGASAFGAFLVESHEINPDEGFRSFLIVVMVVCALFGGLCLEQVLP